MKKIKNLSTFAGIVTIAILLGSALLAPTLSAYADQGKGKSAAGNNDNDKNNHNVHITTDENYEFNSDKLCKCLNVMIMTKVNQVPEIMTIITRKE